MVVREAWGARRGQCQVEAVVGGERKARQSGRLWAGVHLVSEKR